MAADFCNLGDYPKVYVTFHNRTTGEYIDPAAVMLSVRTPDGTVTTYVYGEDGSPIQQEATGRYYAFLDADQAGTWFYRWWATGDGQSAEEKRFEVRTARAV